MSTEIPKQFKKLQTDYPDVFQSYEAFSSACHKAGPLDDKQRRLIKLALAVAIGSEGAVHSNVRRALDEGLTSDEIKHVAVLAFASIGLPKAQAALSWVEDIL
ncbi:MAG: carboxymuconolactone decarboxylase family protein [Caldithrix sp.]|nr:carboxymuconolactone decarboxylase family protein [Caldithrix sp.]